ncbi:MAG: Rab family GTPase [Candidatus Helarchaeota archaeon]
MPETKTFAYKLCVVGDPSVGKTSLIRRYADRKFDESYLPTIGADFTIKKINLDESNIITLTIWDMGGHERFDRIRNHYYIGANAAFIVFDLSRRETFNHVKDWLNDIKSHCGEIPILIIANKADLPNKAISKEEIEKDFSNKNCQIFLTSAKTGENVDTIFEVIANQCFKFYDSST